MAEESTVPGSRTCWRLSDPRFAAVMPVACGSSLLRRASQPKRFQSRPELAIVFRAAPTPLFEPPLPQAETTATPTNARASDEAERDVARLPYPVPGSRAPGPPLRG